MLNFGNKEFRNLEEQVGKNQEDISRLLQGIIISYSVSTIEELSPLLIDANVGKYVYVSTPKKLYLISHRANGGMIADNLGDWPRTPSNGVDGTNGTNGTDGLGIIGVSTNLPQSAREGELFIHLVQDGSSYHSYLKRYELGAWNTKSDLRGKQGIRGEQGTGQVIANPTGSASAELTKIDIDGVIYSLAGGAVDSVNGQTGIVVLDAADVGALPDDTEIPSKTSDLTNDSGFITSSALSGYATENYVDESVTGLVTQSEVDNSIEEALEDYTPTADLATVATSGAYSDLSGKPNLATVATSGSYNDLSNKPTIPTKTSDLTNDSGFISSTGSMTFSGNVTVGGEFEVNDIASFNDAVAITNNQLTVQGHNILNEINSKQNIIDSSNKLPASNVSGLATVATSGAYSDLSGKPNLATVATSGSYNDLSNKPTIPTKTSDLTNDSGFTTQTYVDNKTDFYIINATAAYNYTLDLTQEQINRILLNDNVIIYTKYGYLRWISNAYTNGNLSSKYYSGIDGNTANPDQAIVGKAYVNLLNSTLTIKGVYVNKVSGTDDGTNWTNITINGTTKAIPQGSSNHLYRHLCITSNSVTLGQPGNDYIGCFSFIDGSNLPIDDLYYTPDGIVGILIDKEAYESEEEFSSFGVVFIDKYNSYVNLLAINGTGDISGTECSDTVTQII